MLEPAGERRAAVIIIPGSGPTDRDGNSPFGLNSDTYKLLAEELADAGIASLRIDKRGLFGSTEAVLDPEDVSLAAYAEDTRRWVALLRERGYDCVWLAGHSEGGLVALKTAQEPAGLCGLLLLATPGRPIGDVLRAQFDTPLAAALKDPAFALIERFEAGERIPADEIPAPLMSVFRPGVQGFLLDLLAHDPAALIAAYDGPIMIVQGTSDLQVTLADAERLARAQPAASLLPLADTSHMLKPVAGPGLAANLATYSDPSMPLAPDLVPALTAFMADRTEQP
ncbi:MAG: alpha/beta fold hydrolase [Pseudomonadota bacterium]